MLLAEAGVHRLVRISPYDQASRRHTSFASLFVWPELPDDVDVEIEEKDLRVDTFRSSGAGGQHVNVTDSAVRLTHLPTGIVVSCQNERSQHKNRAQAMKVLKARLYDLKLKEQQAKLEQLGGEKKDIAFGSQIRSYVLHPYQMVKDHRTKEEVGDVNRVLDGDLDVFIKTYLMKKAPGRSDSRSRRRGLTGTLHVAPAASRSSVPKQVEDAAAGELRAAPGDLAHAAGLRAGDEGFRDRAGDASAAAAVPLLSTRHEDDVAGRIERWAALFAVADPGLHDRPSRSAERASAPVSLCADRASSDRSRSRRRS